MDLFSTITAALKNITSTAQKGFHTVGKAVVNTAEKLKQTGNSLRKSLNKTQARQIAKNFRKAAEKTGTTKKHNRKSVAASKRNTQLRNNIQSKLKEFLTGESKKIQRTPKNTELEYTKSNLRSAGKYKANELKISNIDKYVDSLKTRQGFGTDRIKSRPELNAMFATAKKQGLIQKGDNPLDFINKMVERSGAKNAEQVINDILDSKEYELYLKQELKLELGTDLEQKEAREFLRQEFESFNYPEKDLNLPVYVSGVE